MRLPSTPRKGHRRRRDAPHKPLSTRKEGADLDPTITSRHFKLMMPPKERLHM